MPRAFLIKKHHQSSSSRSSSSSLKRKIYSDEEDITDYEPKDYSSRKIKKEEDLVPSSSDCGSDRSLSSPPASVYSTTSPSATTLHQPNSSATMQHAPAQYLYYRHPFIKDEMPTAATALIARSSMDIYGRPPSVLEPININASTVPVWVKPYLQPSYLPPYRRQQQQRTTADDIAMMTSAVVRHHHQFYAPQPSPSYRHYPDESLTMMHHRHSPIDDDECLDLAFVKKSTNKTDFNEDVYSSTKINNNSKTPTQLPWTKLKFKKDPNTSSTVIDDVIGADDDVIDDDYVKNRVASSSSSPSPPPTAVSGGGGNGNARRRATGNGPRYHCPDCNKSYSTYSGLSKHQQFHCSTNNKRTFSCKYCEKIYVSLGALKMHIRTHTLPCKCKLCGKAFSRPWLLQGHIRTHTGEKPFSCPHCNRAFADRSNLRAHLQTHSDVKKYSCKTCAKTFSRMSLLLKHEDNSGCCLKSGETSPIMMSSGSYERLGP